MAHESESLTLCSFKFDTRLIGQLVGLYNMVFLLLDRYSICSVDYFIS